MNQNLTAQCGAEKNSEILGKYIKFREANNKSKNTIKGDLVTLNKLIKFTKNKPFKEIDESDLQGFMKTLQSLNELSTEINFIYLTNQSTDVLLFFYNPKQFYDFIVC